MAFGGGGSFSFGNTNNNTGSTFGGFGSSANNTGGFGQTTTNTGFGSSTQTANPFSSGGTGGFGTNSGGAFGNTNTAAANSLFGAKPSPFGQSTATTTGTSLFGNSTNNTAGGFGGGGTGFGTTNTAGGFGSTNNAGSGFSFGGANKTAGFGSNTTSTPLFGQGGQGTTGGFGATTTTSPFGGTGTALQQQPVPPSEGTAVIPFAPTVEKDTPNGTQSNAYQSIVFQPPYQNYSFEELRIADYNAGRRYGNAGGQAGAFGSSTFGGGFGSTNTGGFGSNSGTTGLFGNNQQSSATGFGTKTSSTGFGGGTLFGSSNANKPTNGLFGQQSSAATSGGLFGTSSSNTGGFGGTSTGFGGGSTGVGLFGGNNQQQQKPSLFGNSTTTGTGSGFSFGGNNNATNTNTGTGLFGNTTQQPATGGFGTAFGNNSAQSQQKPLFGTNNTTGAFGSAAAPAQTGNLFGQANNQSSTSGLFGNNTNTGTTQQSSGIFGGGSSTGTGVGLFGSNNTGTDQKQSGLFGNSFGQSTAGNTGGTLFGNTQNQQQQQQGQTGGTLFGGAGGNAFSFGNSNTNQQKPSLFSNTTSNPSGVLFGGSTNNNNNSLFGNLMNNQQQGQQQQNGPKVASLLDSNPYGQSSIWTGLPTATPQNSGPLVTPLSAANRLKESKARPPPILKLNQSRYMTPPRRPGFGFSYSTYGTPNSVASTPGTGGMSGSTYGRSFASSLGRSAVKSYSATNLRQQFSSDGESVLNPGAFTPGSSRFSSGSIRRLTIDRSLRQDLFSPRLQALPAAPTSFTNNDPSKNKDKPATITNSEQTNEQPKTLKKRVSFDKSTTGGSTNGEINGESGALVQTETDEDSPVDEQQSRGRRGKPTNGEMEQVRGNELAVVPEDRESDITSSMRLPTDANPQPDPEPGEYWMTPSRAELSKMSRDKLRSLTNFQVGRRGCGYVTFNGAVDLTSVNLDDVYDKIVEIRVRSITVYPEASLKPPMGKGLNVPSTLYIENSWPRARNRPSAATSGPVFEKHIQRLKRMAGTDFVNYDVKTGVWIFKVPHYTRYGLDYDDDDEAFGDSIVDLPSGEGTAQGESPADVDFETPEVSSPDDDTFAFKQKTLPGGFGRSSAIDFDPPESGSDSESLDASAYQESDEDEDIDMAGSFPQVVETQATPEPILKASQYPWGTPGRPLLDLDGDWAEQLQRTISPRKQNREALREVQSKVLLDRAYEPIKPRPAEKQDFRTSLDIMNSLFGKHQERMAAAAGKKTEAAGPDFEFPYAKRAKIFDSHTSDMSPTDQAWHASFKPHWNGRGQLTHAVDERNGWRSVALQTMVSKAQLLDATQFQTIMQTSSVGNHGGVPFISHTNIPFVTLAQYGEPTTEDEMELECEASIYSISHILFDVYEDKFTAGLSPMQQRDFEHHIRKDRLTDFLATLIYRKHNQRATSAEKKGLFEEAAVLHLACHDVSAACDSLMHNKDHHLALLVAQVDQADETFQEDIMSQLNDWKEQNIISEMSEPIRALYEILSGNTSVCEGKSSGPVEDRASSFAISDRFELDWLQAFGMSLWYGPSKNGSVEDAIIGFHAKLTSGEEPKRPIDEDGRESILWVLLKLFASRKGAMERPLLPQALAMSSMRGRENFNSYAAFALYHTLFAKLSAKGEVAVDDSAADHLASDLAFELSAAASNGSEVQAIIGAVYALLHINDDAIREANIKDLLNHFGAWLPSPVSPQHLDEASHRNWTVLTTQLGIPTQWLFEAKALHARAMQDADSELRYLVAAKQWEVAHECLCRRVAPQLVIDQDWEGLEDALALFAEHGGPETLVKGWASGGGVFVEFVRAVSAQSRGGEGDLKGLQAALVEMGRRVKGQALGKKVGVEELQERVACREMSRAVAEMLGPQNPSSILPLPLTADSRLMQTRSLSVEYYRGIMAAAR